MCMIKWRVLYVVFFFKQKTAYEMRISDWSSDVCSSDLGIAELVRRLAVPADAAREGQEGFARGRLGRQVDDAAAEFAGEIDRIAFLHQRRIDDVGGKDVERHDALERFGAWQPRTVAPRERIDRRSPRLTSSH